MAIQPPNTPSKLLGGNYPQTPQTPQTQTPQSTNQQANNDPYEDFINQFPVNAPNSPSSQTPTTGANEANEQLFQTPTVTTITYNCEHEFTKANGATIFDSCIETERFYTFTLPSKSTSRVVTTPTAPINRELFPESPVSDSEGNTSVDFQSYEENSLSTISGSPTEELLDPSFSDDEDTDGDATDNEDNTTNTIKHLDSVSKNLFGDEDEEGSASF